MELTPGTFVRDRDGGDERALVVGRPEARADEYFVDVLDGTVADHFPNREYPDDDPIAEVVFERALADRSGWTAREVVEAYRAGDLDESVVYAYPVSRLVPVE